MVGPVGVDRMCEVNPPITPAPRTGPASASTPTPAASSPTRASPPPTCPEAEGQMGLRHDRRRPADGDRRLAVRHQPHGQVLRARRQDRLRPLGGRRRRLAHHADDREVRHLAQRLGDLRRRSDPHGPRHRRPDRQGDLEDRPAGDPPGRRHHRHAGRLRRPGVRAASPPARSRRRCQPTYRCCTLPRLAGRAGSEDRQDPVEDLRHHRAAARHPQELGRGELQGPAGGAIWSAPTADAKRGLVYVATGDSYTDADDQGRRRHRSPSR